MPYSTQANIESIFGLDNVARWSQLDNDQASANVDRIDAAIAWADTYIDCRMVDGPYTVPLSGTRTALIVRDWSAKLAGWWLYRSRGFGDDTDGDKINEHRAAVEREIADVLGGVVRFDAATGEAGGNAPWIVE